MQEVSLRISYCNFSFFKTFASIQCKSDKAAPVRVGVHQPAAGAESRGLQNGALDFPALFPLDVAIGRAAVVRLAGTDLAHQIEENLRDMDWSGDTGHRYHIPLPPHSNSNIYQTPILTSIKLLRKRKIYRILIEESF